MPGTAASGGRNKKTSQLHVLAGTFRGDRHGDAVAPEPPKGKPEPPKPLDGDALEEWDRMIGRMESSGTLSKVDDAALYQHCRLFAETEQIERTQAETSETVRILQENFDGKDDLSFENMLAVAQEITKLKKLEASYISQVRQGRMAIRQYLVEFGMTPAARSRVKLPAKPQQSKAEQFRAAKAGA